MPSANNCLLFFCQIAPLFLAKSPPTTLIMLWSLPSFSVVSPCCWLLFCFVSPAPTPACATFGSAKGGSSGAGFAYQAKIHLLLLAAAAFAVNNLSKIWPCEPTYFHFRCHRGRLSRLFFNQSRRCLHRFMFRRSGINYLGSLAAAQLTLQAIFVSTFLRFHDFGMNSFIPLKVIAFSDFQRCASFCTELIGNASH